MHTVANSNSTGISKAKKKSSSLAVLYNHGPELLSLVILTADNLAEFVLGHLLVLFSAVFSSFALFLRCNLAFSFPLLLQPLQESAACFFLWLFANWSW